MGLLPAEWRLQDYRRLGVLEMATRAAASMESPWPKVSIWLTFEFCVWRNQVANRGQQTGEGVANGGANGGEANEQTGDMHIGPEF